jgi:hypothetical protein
MSNDDAVVSRDEVFFAAGLHATYRIATNTSVDTAGQMQMDGSRKWDLSAALTGDQDVLVQTLAPSGYWYGPDFGTATYATQLSVSQNLIGVFQADTSLLLLGVVSPDNGTMKTELKYNPEVVTLSFPLQASQAWSTNSQVSGTLLGVPALYTEAYASQVDAYGTLVTPLATFHVVRVGTVLTRTVGVVVTVIRSVVFQADCFGTVAAVTSNNNETQSEFTTAAEVRRLAP